MVFLHTAVLVAPGPGREDRGWQARWRDPDRGSKWTAVSLGPRGLDRRTEEERITWAIQKSRTLKARAAAIESGEAAASGLPFPKAVENFLELKANEGKPRTVADLRSLLRPFLEWVGNDRTLTTTAAFKAPHAFGYRDFVMGLRRTVPKTGERVGRGARNETDQLLSPGTRNGYLSAAQRFLNYARRRGLLSISSDVISDALRGAYVEAKRTIIRDRDVLRGMVAAAVRRDRARGEVLAGPLVLVALLLGPRSQEIAGLDWSEVHLDGTGWIEFAAFRTKTKRSRRVDLAVSPAITAVLSRLWLRAGRPAAGPVFGDVNMREVRGDLITTFKSPVFKWKHCRSTSGSFLACAKACGYTLAMVAARLGHAVDVCEKHYFNTIHDVPRDADTVEKAMSIDAEASKVVGMLGAGTRQRATSDSHRSSSSRWISTRA